jgi:nucleoside phosphorylase
MAERILSYLDYTVACICALLRELAAVRAMCDETHPNLPSTTPTHCSYTLGKIEGHNVVLACLPSGVYGTISATAVVTHLQPTFPNVRYGLIVGIRGGVPNESADIRLGDVVVGKPTGSSSGVV